VLLEAYINELCKYHLKETQQDHAQG